MTTNLIVVEKLFNNFLDFLKSFGKKTKEMYDMLNVYRDKHPTEKLAYARTFIKPHRDDIVKFISHNCVMYNVDIRTFKTKDVVKFKRFFQAFSEL